jgi:hypothetical protein
VEPAIVQAEIRAAVMVSVVVLFQTLQVPLEVLVIHALTIVWRKAAKSQLKFVVSRWFGQRLRL